MSYMLDWMAAEAADESSPQETQKNTEDSNLEVPTSVNRGQKYGIPTGDTSAETDGATLRSQDAERQEWGNRWEDWESKRARRIYRGRTVAMLRKYMRYSIETGRLPSLLGREFFRAKVTSYIVVTFEDRVIFVHDMERCLEKLDEFSRELIARRILQEHDSWATARLLHCGEKTVRRLTPLALDLLSEILLEVGLLDRIGVNRENSCQEGYDHRFFLSHCEGGKNKF